MLDKPVILRIPVMVFCGPESVSDSLDAIHNRTGKIIRGIYSVDKRIRPLVQKTGFLLVLG